MRLRPHSLLPLTLLAVVMLAISGCGDDEAADGAASLPEATGGGAADPGSDQKPKPKPKPTGTTIKTADSQFGPVLFDGDDQAIYLFDKEAEDVSECYDDCAVAWPPVLTQGDPAAAGQVAQGKLGTTERDDGTTQVTYSGHPLYYYVDEGPGVVACSNVAEFGGTWFAVTPAGNAV